MRSMEVSMNQYLRKKAAKEGIASTWRGLFDVVSSAQLLEESWYPSSAEVHTSEMFSTFAREEVGIVVTTASQLKEDVSPLNYCVQCFADSVSPGASVLQDG